MLLPPGYEFYSKFLFSFGPLRMQELDLTLSVRNERPHKPYIIGQLFDEAQSLRRTTDRSVSAIFGSPMNRARRRQVVSTSNVVDTMRWMM